MKHDRVLKKILGCAIALRNPIPIYLDWAGLNHGKYQVKTRNDFSFVLRGGTSDRGVIWENFVLRDYFKLGQSYKIGDIVIDIGANIGCYSVIVGRLVGHGKVFAIEPESETFSTLVENIEKNVLSNISVHNIAIGGENSKRRLFTKKNCSDVNSFYRDTQIFNDDRTDFEWVQVKKLEDFFYENNIEICNLLKMDCEGAEYEIFTKSDPKIFDKIEQVIVELHRVDDTIPTDILVRLSKLGYKTVRRGAIVYAKR